MSRRELINSSSGALECAKVKIVPRCDALQPKRSQDPGTIDGVNRRASKYVLGSRTKVDCGTMHCAIEKDVRGWGKRSRRLHKLVACDDHYYGRY
jgi:hypothetical protein